MINIILTDAILRIEWEVKTNPEDYAYIGAELQELMLVMKTFQDFLSSPTLEQLENLESDTPKEVNIAREELLEKGMLHLLYSLLLARLFNHGGRYCFMAFTDSIGLACRSIWGPSIGCTTTLGNPSINC